MKISLFTIVFLLFSTQLLAVTATWVATSGNWDVPANWSTGVIPDAMTDVIITGLANNVTIPSNFNAEAKSVLVQSNASLTISTDATLTINGSTLDALTIDQNGTVNNNGILTIGNMTSIGRNAIVISSSSILNNNSSSSIHINNIAEVAFGMDLLAELNNAGAIHIGSTAPVNGAGFAMDNESVVTNQSSGLIEVNNILSGDGFYMQLSDVINNGTIHVGNLHPILNRGFSLELNSQFSNASSATTTIDNITSTVSTEGIGIFMSSNSSCSNNGTLLIGNSFMVSNNGIKMYFDSDFFNFNTGVIEINNISNFDGISLTDEFTNFINNGLVKVGNNGSVKRMGLITSSLSLFNNSATGTLNIDQINGTASSQGVGIYVNSSVTNSGIINIGTNSSLTQYGIFIASPGALTNQSGATIQINNISSYDGILLNGSTATATNNGTIHIGNLLAVRSDGISMFASSSFTNNGTGTISINNITNTATSTGYGMYLGTGTTFTNKGTINIGNISTVSVIGIFVTGNLINQNAGLIQINNIVYFDAIYGSNAGTSISNSATIRIGNLSSVKRYGIYIVTSCVFNNNSGSIEINSINSTTAGQGYGLVMTSGSTFNNNATINIGNISNISQLGLYVGTSSTFNNQTLGILKISRVGLYDGIQLVGSTAIFNNAGQVKIGEHGPVNRIGVLNSGGQFNNQTGSLLQINSITTSDGIQVFNSGAALTNNGTIHIGNVSGVYRLGIIVSTSGTFTNGATGSLTINNLLSTAANEGIALRLSSGTFINNNLVDIGNLSAISRFGIAMSVSSTFTNNSSGLLHINRIVSQSAISLQTTSKLNNSGTINVGNTHSINVVGIVATGGAEVNNNVGGSLAVNNTTTSDAIYISGSGTKLINNALINIGNLTSINGKGINADLGALVQNNSVGVMNISNTSGDNIFIDGVGTIFTNKGSVTNN
jgi:hypothetical protein